MKGLGLPTPIQGMITSSDATYHKCGPFPQHSQGSSSVSEEASQEDGPTPSPKAFHVKHGSLKGNGPVLRGAETAPGLEIDSKNKELCAALLERTLSGTEEREFTPQGTVTTVQGSLVRKSTWL